MIQFRHPQSTLLALLARIRHTNRARDFRPALSVLAADRDVDISVVDDLPTVLQSSPPCA